MADLFVRAPSWKQPNIPQMMAKQSVLQQYYKLLLFTLKIKVILLKKKKKECVRGNGLEKENGVGERRSYCQRTQHKASKDKVKT